jgi:uncharacterized protein (DUF736 family)
MLRNITIHKRKEVKTANQPTHDLVASDEKYENKTIVGAMWTRVTEEGNKFLSGTLSKPRTHEGKEYDGYVIITEKEYNELKSPTVEPQGYNGEIDDISQIPF